jgi:hypothetical protein
MKKQAYVIINDYANGSDVHCVKSNKDLTMYPQEDLAKLIGLADFNIDDETLTVFPVSIMQDLETHQRIGL